MIRTGSSDANAVTLFAWVFFQARMSEQSQVVMVHFPSWRVFQEMEVLEPETLPLSHHQSNQRTCGHGSSRSGTQGWADSAGTLPTQAPLWFKPREVGHSR